MKLIAQDSHLDLSHPHVMGILNVTPDSFSDGGTHNTLIEAVKHANLMINAGATIIDVGGESTRPGAAEVSVEEELARVVPVVEAIAQRFEVWISVDTSKPEVIREVARVGAHIINDIRSLTEPGAIEAAAETGLPVCLMHMQGKPKTMQDAPKRRLRHVQTLRGAVHMELFGYHQKITHQTKLHDEVPRILIIKFLSK